VQIEGFYDEVQPPTDEDLDLIEKIRLATDVEQLKSKLHIENFKGGAPWETLLRNYYLDPVLNIDGYESGYTDEGVLTNLPHQALAKLDIRLVPNMTVDHVLLCLRRHLDKYGFPEVTLKKMPGGYDWYRTPVSEDIIQAIISATVKHGVKPQLWPAMPWSFPGSVYAKPPLSLPMGTSGLGRGGWAHSANEYITVEGIRDHEKYTVTLLYEYAKL
jgi:acetylornithine deacetylase/succinyl-diaminopimelate desuccinylase-like protein